MEQQNISLTMEGLVVEKINANIEYGFLLWH